MSHAHDDEMLPDDESGFPERPSKSQRKRDMHALQDLGEQLVALSLDQLKKVPMSESLADAVREAKRITSHEGRRRQMQYLGKLMRNVDPAPIQAQLDVFNGISKAEIARQHRLERLRADLLDDEKTLQAIGELWPEADFQQLRTLRRNAIKERELNKPPRAFREIFRILRDLDAAAGEGGAADAAADDGADE
ncbi:MAG: ribosome-associated protein [Azoarcus sp.]|uniref:Dual-action ribosomal maturation protein DarP n=1 Tax=Aromatoleum tolulyticum TaxID=34027 RepID=A0A1N6SDK0_9RHOO|nr:ribosome biogenesis factor YjgA [Aromatoleum tolulyticum]MCK9986819.1 ribosome-associated protein [Azoarcus sp.]SIQ39198.1 ribosome-associated protein [Aromatoleum tolulyticum]